MITITLRPAQYEITHAACGWRETAPSIAGANALASEHRDGCGIRTTIPEATEEAL